MLKSKHVEHFILRVTAAAIRKYKNLEEKQEKKERHMYRSEEEFFLDRKAQKESKTKAGWLKKRF